MNPANAKLLRGGVLPEAYVYAAQMRATRDLMRRRTFLVCERAALQGRVKLVSMQYNMPAIREDLRWGSGQEVVLERFSFADDVKASVAANMDLILDHNTVIRRLEKKILQSARGHCREDLELPPPPSRILIFMSDFQYPPDDERASSDPYQGLRSTSPKRNGLSAEIECIRHTE